MKPILVRPVTEAEFAELYAGLRSPSAFALRRCQCLLASAAGHAPAAIAAAYGCSDQMARDLIRDFAGRGTDCLAPRPRAPKRPRSAWPRERDAELKALAHQSPRSLGKPTSLRTLDLLAAARHEKGWTARVLSGEAIRQAFGRLGVSRKRAEHWPTGPDPEYATKIKARDDLIAEAARHPDWVPGLREECWWTRMAQPGLHSRTGGDPLHLRQRPKPAQGDWTSPRFVDGVSGLWGLEGRRGDVPRRGVQAHPVVEHLDVPEDRPLGGGPRGERLAVDQLLLQAREERLHRRVVESSSPRG